MANKQRGEVAIPEFEGMVLKLSTNAICELELLTGKGVNEFAEGLNDASKFKISDMRTIFYACLKGGKSPVDSQEDAGDLVDQIGFERVSELVVEAFQLAFPEAAKNAGKPKAA